MPQIVGIRGRVEEIRVPRYVEVPAVAPLFAGVADGDLPGFGVPAEWLSDIRAVTNDDTLLALTDHVPGEASEALSELATDGIPAAVRAVTVAPRAGSFC